MASYTIPMPPAVTVWLGPDPARGAKVVELLEMARCEVTQCALPEQPPTREELQLLLDWLVRTPGSGVKALGDLVNREASVYQERGLVHVDDDNLQQHVLQLPDELLRTPIAIASERQLAIIARPPELALQLLLPPIPDGTSVDELMRRGIQKKFDLS